MTYNKVIDLLYTARENGIDIFLNEERLQLKVAKGRPVDDTLLEAIRTHKELIVDYLSDVKWKTKKQGAAVSGIQPADRKALQLLPLSFSQERLWFIDQLHGSVQYNMPFVFRLNGNLNIAVLERAFKEIVQRHEILRTVIREKDGVGYQVILPASGWKWKYLELAEITSWRAYAEELIQQPFDLANDYMLKAAVIRLSAAEHALAMVVHHIAADAWSLPILTGELVELYRSYSTGQMPQLPELPVQYADYAVWQKNHFTDHVLKAQITFWQRQLADVPYLALPTDHVRPAQLSTKGGVAHLHIDREIGYKINELARSEGATLYMTLLSVFKILLAKYAGQEDICVGSSIAGRQYQEMEGMIGFFVNTLALRSQLDWAWTYRQFLQEVKKTTLAAFEHQELPFEKVVEALGVERATHLNPVFQVMFVLQNTPEGRPLDLGEVTLVPEMQEEMAVKFDLSLTVNESDEGLDLYLMYASDLFEEETMVRMLKHYEQLIREVIVAPERKLEQLNMLTAGEALELKSGRNACIVKYPREKTFTALFEEQVVLTPDKEALSFEGRTLTYQELDAQSNRFAHYLAEQAVKPGELVGLWMDRGIDMMIALMGILKAGAAYVPVDSEYPAERVAGILEDAGVKVLVSDIAIVAGFHVLDVKGAAGCPVTKLAIPTDADALIYVIYTSGSTGRPKGVMIRHHSITDYVYGLKNKIPLDMYRSYALVSSIATDLGNTMIFSALLCGGTLHLFSRVHVSDPDYLQDYFTSHAIDCLKIVPSHWKALSAERPLLPLKFIFFGGEALQADIVEMIRQTPASCGIINHYGPTETTIGKLLHVVYADKVYEGTVPIGQPFSNTVVYIVDKQGMLAPVGVPGELYIGGEGVAAGYLHNAALTAEKFVRDPFNPGGPLFYRTGDIVKYLPDGNILFIGRKDDQVKIRGYRLEPGEVESVLQHAPGVKHAVIVVKGDSLYEKKLVGYIVPGEQFEKESTVSWLKERLPDYMIPAVLVEMTAFPLLPNGKVNRGALPEPEESRVTEVKQLAPSSQLEADMLEIWKRVLEEDLTVHDNFFEKGGHSLLAIRIVSAVRKRLNKEVVITDLFDYPTVAGLAKKLEGDQVASLPFIQPRGQEEKSLPLSYSQERLWFIDRLQGSLQYHTPWVVQLEGDLHEGALEQALREIVKRHEVLRTVIREDGGMVCQFIIDAAGWKLEKGVEGNIDDILYRPFDLSNDYPLRAVLITHGAQRYTLALVVHHIAFDGWSVPLFLQELSHRYNRLKRGVSSHLPTLPLQYADYAIWQRKYLSGAVLDKRLDYWKQQLSHVSVLELPTDHTRSTAVGMRGGVAHRMVHLSDEVRQYALTAGVSPFMLLLGVFQVLLYRYSGQEDICVGSPIAGRHYADLERLIGFFVNTLAIRVGVSPAQSFKDHLERLRKIVLDAYAHQDVPFEKIVEVLQVERDLGRNPVFQVMFSIEEVGNGEMPELSGLHMQPYQLDTIIAKFELSLSIILSSTGVHLGMTYNSELYNEDTVVRMLAHYEQLLRSVLSGTGVAIGEMKMLEDVEVEQLLHTFNAPVVAPADDLTLVRLFRQQAALNPALTAVTFEGRSLTYEELDRMSSRFGSYLQSKSVQRGTLVPISMDRSLEMVIAILGILKAGGAYVPVDPSYPVDRIRYMLSDLGAAFIVSADRYRAQLSALGYGLVLVDEDYDSPVGEDVVLSGGDLAYVIYTSGTTGRPKGVMNRHCGIVNRLLWGQQYFGLTAADAVLQKTSISFDISVWELFWPLTSGARLVLCAPGEQGNSDYLKALISSAGITTIHFVPSMLEVFLEDVTTPLPLRRVLCSGETMSVAVAKKCKERLPDVSLHNLYGPTEAAVEVTYWTVPDSVPDAIPIGRPIANTLLSILDSNDQLCPIGVVGELNIGGVQVAAGYLHQEALTAAKFVNGWYRTGDRCAWRADGTIVFIGRLDEQVKLRGYRIEPEEVAAVMRSASGVRQAIVTLQQEHLVGYVVREDNYEEAALREYLSERLPSYMIPDFIIELPALPLNANGKIDRRSLPGIGVQVSGDATPRTEQEKHVFDLWEELLGVRAGIYDNFFSLGGHSLLAMRLVSRLAGRVSLRDIFVYPTIAGLAKQMSRENSLPAIGSVERTARIPLSYAQERLWFIDRLQGSLQYHMPWVVNVAGELDQAALEQAFREIIHRHEILRTVIREEEGRAYQFIMEAAGWKMQTGGIAADEFCRPFDLSTEYPLRAIVEETGVRQYKLMLVVHHIAFDGWSVPIFLSELAHYYNKVATALPPLPVQYADYAIWQRKYLSGVLLDRKLAYWRHQLDGVSVLELPTDYRRGVEVLGNGGIVHREVHLSEEVRKYALAAGVSPYMLLLGVFQVLLYRYSGQEDICVGSPIAGRHYADLEGLVGFFVNTLAIRTDVSPTECFKEHLVQLRQIVLDAYDHQDVPFEKVVEVLQLERDLARSPVFQVMFSVEESGDGEMLALNGLDLEPYQHDTVSAKFDLSMTVSLGVDELRLGMTYDSDLYNEATVERMLGHYEQLLRSVLSDSEVAIGQLEMLQETEVHQLLEKFNGPVVVPADELTLVSLFHRQVAITPGVTAVTFDGRQLSYEELDAQSKDFGNYLRSYGVKRGALVPVSMDRSLEMVIAILGILKAGGAYVPIDPAYPADRIQYMLSDICAEFLVSTSLHKDQLSGLGYELLLLDEAWEAPEIEEDVVLSGDDLAYVIYTSGTTGRPKGVMNRHRGIVNRLVWGQDYFGLKADDAVLQKTSISFDISVWELFWPLINGARLVLCKPGEQGNSEYLKALVVSEGITTIHFVPSMLEVFLEAVTGALPLRRVLCSGEVLSVAAVRTFKEKLPQVSLHNLYGPTEAAIEVTYWTAPEIVPDEIPIGRPVANTRLYILDSNGQLCPVGVAGELYIGGVQVAAGYLHQEELTAEKFVFGKYRTGDRCKWRADGNIIFMGRLDEQVKLRGYRIEPEEVAAVMHNCYGVHQAVVALKSGHLAGYVVREDGYDEGVLLAYLRERLPSYMIPDFLIELPALPLTKNGKIDRRSLPDIVQKVNDYVAPRTVEEQLLSDIWEELLGVRAGVHDDFFLLGGHSLLAMRLLHRIRSSHQPIRLIDLFRNKTIATQAALLHTQTEPGHLLCLQPDGNGRPVFILPGSEGISDGYLEMAQYFKGVRPVYGIQMQGIFENEVPLTTIGEIARQHLQWIRAQQPAGPYHLIGHSFGAHVLYEMVQQLEAAGERADKVIIIDPPYQLNATIDQLRFIKAFVARYEVIKTPSAVWVQQLDVSLQAAPAIDHIEIIAQAFHQHAADINGDVDFVVRWLQLQLCNLQMTYHPQGNINASLLLVKATTNSHLAAGDIDRWKAHTAQPEMIELEGDHFTIVKDPFVGKLFETNQLWKEEK